MAGPSGADPAVRHYSHDAWNSVSATIKLPVKGAVMGALAPVLTPAEAGERRSFMVAYPIVPGTAADRQSRQQRVGGRHGRRATHQGQGQTAHPAPVEEADKVRGLDRKLARGNALTRPYAIATVTVPKTARDQPSTGDAWTPPSAGPGSPRCAWTCPRTSRSPPPPSRSGISLTRKGSIMTTYPHRYGDTDPRRSSTTPPPASPPRRSCAAKATSGEAADLEAAAPAQARHQARPPPNPTRMPATEPDPDD